MRPKTKAKLYPVKNRNGSFTYRVDLGQGPDGKRVTRGFSTRDQAEEFKSKMDAQIAQKASGSALHDLTQIEKYDFLAARERLRNVDASLVEAADFYLKHNAAHKAVLTIEEALEVWKAQKAKVGLSQKYQNSAVRNFFKPFAKRFKNKKLNFVTSKEIEKYVFKHNKWSARTKSSHLDYLKTFFNFFVKQGNISLNPVTAINKPKTVEQEPRLLSIKNAETLLNYALDKDLKEECAAMTLILFCGFRVDEVDRLTWEAVDLEMRFVTLQGRDSKKGRKRINPISDNAFEWLKACAPGERRGRIGPSDYSQRLKRLRAKVKEANPSFDYPQNAMRHSFAAYHLAKNQDATKTAFMLGHPNANLLYNTYKSLTTTDQAEKYWNIIPSAQMKKLLEIAHDRQKEEQEIKRKILERS